MAPRCDASSGGVGLVQQVPRQERRTEVGKSRHPAAVWDGGRHATVGRAAVGTPGWKHRRRAQRGTRRTAASWLLGRDMPRRVVRLSADPTARRAARTLSPLTRPPMGGPVAAGRARSAGPPLAPRDAAVAAAGRTPRRAGLPP